MGKIICSGRNARKSVLSGILEAAKTAAVTYGPRGRTVAFFRGNDARLTKDGITVLREIDFSDELKKFGAMLVKEASSKSNFQGGDGSTSTAILTGSLCETASNLLDQGIDINELRVGFKRARDTVLDYLPNLRKTIDSDEDIKKIALVSSNGDNEIADLVTEAFTSIGDYGIVTIADSMSRSGESKVVLSNGIEFNKGFLSSQCVNASNDQCILNNPGIIFFSKAQNDLDVIAPIISFFEKNDRPVVLIAPDFDDSIATYFKEKLSKKLISGSLILAPGSTKLDITERLTDLAVLTGTVLYGEQRDVEDFSFDDIGTCDTITITKNKTTFSINEYKDENAVNEHLKSLQTKLELDSAEEGYSEYEKERLKERIARMTGGVATILVGALTAPELSEKKDRYEDAINAVRAALSEGFVPGAGTALLKTSYQNFDNIKVELTIAQKTAFSAFMTAIRKPAKLLISSTGEDTEVVIPNLLNGPTDLIFDARRAVYTHAFDESGIIDPYSVIKNSIIYSTSVAEQFFSLDSVIISDVKNLAFKPVDQVLDESTLSW